MRLFHSLCIHVFVCACALKLLELFRPSSPLRIVVHSNLFVPYNGLMNDRQHRLFLFPFSEPPAEFLSLASNAFNGAIPTELGLLSNLGTCCCVCCCSILCDYQSFVSGLSSHSSPFLSASFLHQLTLTLTKTK